MASGDLPIKKIYIDSKFRRKDSVSSSNFKIDLPYTLKLGENTVFYVDDVCGPHTWHTVEQNINDKIENGKCTLSYPKKIYCKYNLSNQKKKS